MRLRLLTAFLSCADFDYQQELVDQLRVTDIGFCQRFAAFVSNSMAYLVFNKRGC